MLGTTLLSVFTVLFLSSQLQKPENLSSTTRAAFNLPSFDMPNIDINIPKVDVPQTSLPEVNIPSSDIPDVNIPSVDINLTDSPSICPPCICPLSTDLSGIAQIGTMSDVPSIGPVVSQGASVLAQLLSSPEGQNTLLTILGSLFGSPPSSDTPTDTSPAPDTETETPAAVPEQIQLQTCKESDGTKTNTCPARYNEKNAEGITLLVYRQCGANGWCNYTCYKQPGQQTKENLYRCWDTQKPPITSGGKLETCMDTNKKDQKCPEYYPEDGKEVFRGCGASSEYCNYTCFKPGTHEVIDCWEGQNPKEPATAPPPGQSQSSSEPQTTQGGKCHVIPGEKAKSMCKVAEQDVPASTQFSPCMGVSASGPFKALCESQKSKARCTCPTGTCNCQLKDDPSQTITCSNGGKFELVSCQ